MSARSAARAPAAFFNSVWGERAAWIFFLAATLQVTFRQPYIVLAGHERVNLFSGVLCALSLLLAVAFSPRRALLCRSWGGLLSLALIGLATVSSLLSADPQMSGARAFVILAAGLGGYWSARLLLADARRQVFWVWFGLALFVLVALSGFLGQLFYGAVHRLLDMHFHPLGGRLILLAFAPLALLYGVSRCWAAAAGAVLLSGYALFLLAHKYSTKGTAVLIPAAMCLAAACFRRWPSRQFIAVLALVFLTSLLAGGKIYTLSAYKNRYHDSVSYRLENFAFSWHLTRQHPFFGIGLWAPRDAYLRDYQITYPYLAKEDFVKWTRELKTSENNYLTFMADLGLPFLLLYGGALGFILVRLLQQAARPAAGAIIPPLALLLPVLGEVLHFNFYDGLFHPQVSWLFHILLGLVPLARPAPSPVPRAGRDFLARTLLVLLVVAAGVGAGVCLAAGL